MAADDCGESCGVICDIYGVVLRETNPRRESIHICDFSRGGLNARFRARIQLLLRGHKYGCFLFLGSDFDKHLEYCNCKQKFLQSGVRNFLRRFDKCFEYIRKISACSADNIDSFLGGFDAIEE